MDSVVSNSTTGIFGAGRAPGNVNTIDKITIASTANATDYGDLSTTTNNVCGASNGHGGLSTTDFSQQYTTSADDRALYIGA